MASDLHFKLFIFLLQFLYFTVNAVDGIFQFTIHGNDFQFLLLLHFDHCFLTIFKPLQLLDLIDKAFQNRLHFVYPLIILFGSILECRHFMPHFSIHDGIFYYCLHLVQFDILV